MRLRNSTLLCLFSLLASLILAAGLSAQLRPDPFTAHASSRISANIDDRALQSLPGNHYPLARPEFDAGAVSASRQMQSMVLVLQSSAQQQAALEALLEAQRDPASPYYRQWLPPGQFAEHYGVSTEDVQRITNWLQGHGMHIDEVSPSRRSIIFSGTASQVERAFATSMRSYRVNGAMHLANAIDPSVPSALAPVVNGVLSLHDFPLLAMHSAVHAPVAQFTSGTAHYVTPADLAIIYNVNPLYTQGIDGSGQSVAVVARSNINISDVRTFRSTFGLPANDPQIIVNGKDPGTSNFSELAEATLDAEYAGALARKATVKFVTSASTSATDGSYLSAQYIVNQNLAPVMTMSFGLCEAQLGASGNAFINSLWQQAAAQGITVLVAAGDSGAAGCDDASSSTARYGLAVNGLCSTPYDLCIGGTQFNDTANPSLYWSAANVSGSNASALGYIPEAVWNESGTNSALWAGAGGASAMYAKPAWQSGKGVPADGKRDVPDISLAAAGHDGYMIVMNGQRYVIAGTSASSPALASMLTLLVQGTGARLGVANANLYALAARQNTGSAAIFHDITTGNNSVPGVAGYNAGAGYDLASGLGSVDANALVAHWRDGALPPSIQLTLNKTSLTIAPGAAAPIIATVAGSGGFNAAVTLSTSGLPAGLTAAFSPAIIASPGSGISTLQLTAASTMAAGTYTFNIVATSGALTSSAAITVTVLAPTLTLSASDTAITILPGSSRAITLISTGNAALNTSVTLKVSGLPSGVTAVFSPSTIAAPGSGTSTLTFASASSAQPGSYIVLITATAGSLTKTVQLILDLPLLSASASTTSLTMAQGASASLTLTTKSAGGFNSAATIAISGLPSGVTAALTPPSIPSPGAGTVSIKLTASATATLGAAKLLISASGGGLAASVPLTLTITPLPTFTFTSPSTSATVKIGGSAVIQLTSAAQNGFTSPLTLSATGAPAGVNLKFGATTISPGQGTTLTIITTASTAPATAKITVTASGAAQSKTVTIALTVFK